MADTTSVSVVLTLDSADSTAPFNFSNLSGQVNFSDGTQSNWTGWNEESIGTPEPNGAAFSLAISDVSWGANQSSILNWALTFIPRVGTTQDSPFGNSQNTITGTGAANATGTFTLNLGNVRIKNAGDWDWTLMAQVSLSSGVVHCFASDPQMEVGDGTSPYAPV